MITEAGQREQEREKRAREKRFIDFFSDYNNKLRFFKYLFFRKVYKGRKKPSLGEHSSPTDD